MKKLTGLIFIFNLLGIASWAQEVKNEVTVQGSGFFQKQTTNSGITNDPSNSGGVNVGYRRNLTKWFAVEGDYDYFRNHQTFETGSGTTFVPTNVHAATAVGVVKLPAFKTKMPALKVVSPFVLAGGGAMFFDPRGGFVSTEQTRGACVYGGGVDVPLSKHFLVRAQYRGFVYKIPDFDMASVKTDKYTHSAAPSAGLVFTF